MKNLSLIALGATLFLGATFPASAQTEMPETPATITQPANPQFSNEQATNEQVLTGKVESIESPEVSVQFSKNSTQTYRLDPALVQAMNLSKGSTVAFGDHKLGTIVNINRSAATVEFANGESDTYYLSQEGRATLTFGDRIVVTPDQRLARAENYILGAADVKDSASTLALGMPSESNQPVVNPVPKSVAPAVPPATTAPVEAAPVEPMVPAPVTPGTPF
ncbi:MAG: hypothetical protein MH252_15215 [Thermosynechococcaceae cyanobacterium MS004]|nr:hypothetical protein [Thermosynechococcaceae cyanobacterium MS004]